MLFCEVEYGSVGCYSGMITGTAEGIGNGS
ncbi:MAG: hypothetical protein ACI8XG_000866 [Congregibacter sp.]|jgi:hypothetical protein